MTKQCECSNQFFFQAPLMSHHLLPSSSSPEGQMLYSLLGVLLLLFPGVNGQGSNSRFPL